MLKHKKMRNVWCDGYVNYPDLLIIHCVEIMKFHSVSLNNVQLKKKRNMKSETHISLYFPHYIRTCYSVDATNMLFTWFHFHLPPNIQIYPSDTSFPHFIPTNMFFDSMIVFFSLIFCLCLSFAFYSIFLILFCIIIRLVLKLLTPSMK